MTEKEENAILKKEDFWFGVENNIQNCRENYRDRMVIMTINQLENKYESVVLVDYNNSRMLRDYQVSFHWWNSEATSLHCHNFYEFFIVTDGSVVHEINHERFELCKGTLQLIRPKDRHRISALSEEGSAHMNISLTGQKFRQMCQALCIDMDELLEGGSLQASLSVDELDFFIKRAEKISFLNFNHNDESRVIVCELLFQAISIVYKARLFSRFDYPEWFVHVLERIHSPELTGCTAKDVYDLAGFSAPAMIGYFKEYTGQTVSEYLRGVKLKQACEILRDSSMPILELSNLLGYASLSHFNRIFKERIGLTPAAYRKAARR